MIKTTYTFEYTPIDSGLEIPQLLTYRKTRVKKLSTCKSLY